LPGRANSKRCSNASARNDRLLNDAVERAPVGELVDILDVGFAVAYLATPYARRITGSTLYVDGGVNIMA
jgi:enoyl-[acyl-carrier protein] reductase I